MRARYDELIARPQWIEQILQDGAARARRIATPLLAEVRHAVGLRRFGASVAPITDTAAPKAALPVFKQYREADGRFYFKLIDDAGELLLQSRGFASPKEAGQLIARLKRMAAVLSIADSTVAADGEPFATLGEGRDFQSVEAALQALSAAD